MRPATFAPERLSTARTVLRWSSYAMKQKPLDFPARGSGRQGVGGEVGVGAEGAARRLREKKGLTRLSLCPGPGSRRRFLRTAGSTRRAGGLRAHRRERTYAEGLRTEQGSGEPNSDSSLQGLLLTGLVCTCENTARISPSVSSNDMPPAKMYLCWIGEDDEGKSVRVPQTQPPECR